MFVTDRTLFEARLGLERWGSSCSYVGCERGWSCGGQLSVLVPSKSIGIAFTSNGLDVIPVVVVRIDAVSAPARPAHEKVQPPQIFAACEHVIVEEA